MLSPLSFIAILFFIIFVLAVLWSKASMKQYKRKYKSSHGKNKHADELADLIGKRIK